MKLVESLSEQLFLTKEELLKFAVTAPHRYKVYSIPKRSSGEKRIIAHPSKELKSVQRAVNKKLLKNFKIHRSAFAYRNGIGIKDNAAQHSGNPFLLKMDFSDFFNNIVPSMFLKAAKFQGVNIEPIDEVFIKGIGFWRPRRKGGLVLSVGAPTSPVISNIVMYEFDEIFSKECLSRGIVYTRYADDITMSTREKNLLFEMPGVVEACLFESLNGKVSVNEKKTVFSSKGHNRHVTGITLTNDDKLSIGRDRKRLISAMIHRFSRGELDAENRNHLRGLLAFAVHIEPDFLARMENKYGEITISQLVKEPIEDS